MKSISISKDGIIEYYGNRAGYIRNHVAVVDEMFRRAEVEQYLKQENGIDIVWKNGVYDRLIKGDIENSTVLKRCRIHQLKPNVDMRMKFIGYDELKQRGFGAPDMSNYRIVYDGDVQTNDLEEIYMTFNQPELPDNYTGYSMSKSDVIELYDEGGSEFYYVDSIGFVKLEAPSSKMANTQKQQTPAAEPVNQEAVQSGNNMASPKESNEEFQVETFKINM